MLNPRRFAEIAVVLACLSAASRGVAQTQSAAPAPLTKDEIAALAKVQVAINVAHDSIDTQLAQSRNKTNLLQQTLRDKLRTQIEQILRQSGMSESEFNRKTFLISSDSAARHSFDLAIAQLTGAPLPGQLPPGANRTVAVPAGPAGVHIGHVINGFSDTPGGQALMSVAMAEATTANQHATLAARNLSDLNSMKTHAGHVLNALDPTVVAAGPGLGYGAKKATAGVATHIDLAAKAEGASPAVVTHAKHVATASANASQRIEQLIALAKQVQSATEASAAAALVSQIVSLSQQVIAGVDSNGDGQITWEEGGLQQADEHVRLMIGTSTRR